MPIIQQKEFIRDQLVVSGNSPKRFSPLVRLIRRLLWPFVRPYFYFVTDNILEIEERVARLESIISKSGLENGENITDMGAIKTDLMALKNRLSLMEKDS